MEVIGSNPIAPTIFLFEISELQNIEGQLGSEQRFSLGRTISTILLSASAIVI